jgi:nucleoside-diphosphate-sugar epimerase
MRVLLTGHNGYIGSVLAPMLQRRGHEVAGLDSDLFGRCTFDGEPPRIPQTSKDIRDVTAEDVAGFDAVIHLAGLSNDPLGDYRPELTDEINYRATVKLARLAKSAGVKRFLFASSCSTYGAAGDSLIDETGTFNPVTPYGTAKVRAEQTLSQMADADFCPTFLRASTAYGVSPRLRFDLVLNNLTAWAFTTGRVYLKSDGTEDISRAYVAALQAPWEAVHCAAFNVGATTENYQIRELAEIVRDVVPDCRIDYAPDAGPDKRCYRVDCNLIARSLHEFKPQWTARRGVEELYAAYRRAPPRENTIS